ncbi:Gfo/Idh/MocA family oxidoreductase [Membranihabitans marinus]
MQSSIVSGGAMVGSPAIVKISNINSNLKVGIVGCGGRGTGAVVQALMAHPGNTLVAMGDLFESHIELRHEALLDVEEIADRVNVPKENKFTGFDAYQKVIKACDVVILATPPGFRPEHFEFAVAEGKHVFMEKPLATDGYGIRRILKSGELADKKGVKVVVGLQNRYDPAFSQMVDQLKAGIIGPILTSTCYYMKGGYKLIPRSSTQNELEFQIKNYHYFNWLWAGAPGGLAIHNTDIVHWAKGTYPISAQGLGGRAKLSGPDTGDTFDHYYIEYTYADGSKLHSQIRNIEKNFNKNGAWITGSKGVANVREGILDHNGQVLWQFDSQSAENSYQVEHDVLFDAIINNKAKNDTVFGAHSSLASIMGRMASHSGQVITWDQALNAAERLVPDIADWTDVPPVKPDSQMVYPYSVPGGSNKYLW